MKLQSLLLRASFLVFAAALTLHCLAPGVAAQSNAQTAATVQTSALPARITQAIDETQLVRLKGNVHPLARPEFDQGPVSDATPMKRMMLLLQRSPEQEAALQQFMAEQMSNESPNFHNWLTPQQFGAQYGPADSDIQTVTSWLASHGFTAVRVAPGRNVIEFSGNVGQVRAAFHTEIHKFLVQGSVKEEERQSNTSDPQIPAALTPVVAGIVSLHNFPSKSMKRDLGAFMQTKEGIVKPLFTGPPNCETTNPPCFYAVGPADFAKIYNIPSSLTGAGGNIAIIGFSDINVTDAHNFRALFGLPVNDPVVVNNGPDPGFNGEEGEADLDTQWSGAVAPNATIHYILSESTLTSDPLFLGAEYVIDNNSDDAMSLSFGQCEASLTSAALSFINSLWEQAAAQGITVNVSAGDNGTAGCDNFNTQATATRGIAVSGIASTPFNIAVGGTDFDDAGNQHAFWALSTANAAGTRESALGYIKEIPWNDSCAATATTANLTTICAGANNIVAGSGGPSAVYAKPAWQNGIIPNGIAAGDNHRYLPDVSLFASDGPNSKSFYVICEADIPLPPGSAPSCSPDAQGHFSFFGAGGTSASAPSFAGIIALIGQSEATAGRSRRQGNANLVLYKIAQTAANSCNSSTQTLTPSPTCVFFNITKNTNSVPCAGTSPNCSSTTSGTNGVLVTNSPTTNTPAFTATAGSGIPSYNLATGLGSVNVASLATAWGTAAGAFKATTSTLLINNSANPGTIAHGTAVTAKVTVAVVAPATGTPSGDVSVLAPSTPTGSINSGNNGGTLSAGVATISGVILPGGTYNVTGHYSGDGTFAPSDSTGVPITVSKENSLLQFSIVTLGVPVNTNAMNFPYGSPYILRFDILNHTGTATNCQPFVTGGVTSGCAFDARGTVTITDNGSPLDQGTFPVNSEGSGEDQPIQLTGGSHTLSATYSGDNSYNAPASPTTDAVTVTPAGTSTAVVPSPASGVTTATPVTLTATISSQSNSATGATGNVVFKDGTATIGTVAAVPAGASASAGAGATATLTQTFSTTGTHSITAAYAGDQNYATSTSTAVNVTVSSSGSFTIGGSAATVAAGSNSTSTITVTPTGGFTGTVNVTCPTANLPPGVTCSPNPLAINVTGTAAVTGNLTVAVAAPSSTTSASLFPADRTRQWATLAPLTVGGKGWWGLSAATGLAAILLLLLPGRKRYRAALAFGLICVLSFSLGCNGGYGGGGGPSPTTTKISVTSTKAPSGTVAFTVTVTSTGTRMPTGSVQLYDGTAVLGTAGTLTNGSTTINISTLSVGTHAINAHYLADAYSTASQSGTLNMAITGTTTFNISASPAASNGNATVNLTIN